MHVHKPLFRWVHAHHHAHGFDLVGGAAVCASGQAGTSQQTAVFCGQAGASQQAALLSTQPRILTPAAPGCPLLTW